MSMFNGFPVLFSEVREGTNDGLLFAILHTIAAVSCEVGAHRLPRKLRPRIKLQLLFRIYSEDAVRLARKHYQFEFLLTVFSSVLTGHTKKDFFSWPRSKCMDNLKGFICISRLTSDF